MLTITSPASWPLGLPTSPPEIGSWAREGAWWTPQREPLWGGAAVTLSERIEQLREPRARVWAPHPPALGPGAAHASCPRRAGRGRGQPGVDPGPPPGADALHRADTLAGSSPAPGLSSPCPRSQGVALPVAPGAPPTLLPRPLLPPTFHLRAGWAAPLTTSAQACGHRFQSLVPTQATLPLGFLEAPTPVPALGTSLIASSLPPSLHRPARPSPLVRAFGLVPAPGPGRPPPACPTTLGSYSLLRANPTEPRRLNASILPFLPAAPRQPTCNPAPLAPLWFPATADLLLRRGPARLRVPIVSACSATASALPCPFPSSWAPPSSAPDGPADPRRPLLPLLPNADGAPAPRSPPSDRAPFYPPAGRESGVHPRQLRFRAGPRSRAAGVSAEKPLRAAGREGGPRGALFRAQPPGGALAPGTRRGGLEKRSRDADGALRGQEPSLPGAKSA